MKSITANAESPQYAATLTIDQALHQAIGHHKAGQLQVAEHMYRAILQVQPNHPDANHNLGVLAGQIGQHVAGLPHLKAALEANPAQGQYWLSYADALLATGQTRDALNIIQSAMQRGLNIPEAQALRQKAEAIALNNANGKAPTPAEINQLVALFNAGRYAEVESRALELLERHPDSGFAWKVLGTSLNVQGKEAVPALQKATELMLGDAEAHYNLGIALQAIGQLDAAVASYRRALEIKPDFAEAHYNLGITLQDLGQLDDAVASYRRALEVKPAYAEAHSNLGNALRDLGRLDEAVASCRRALEVKPDFAEAHNNLAVVLKDLGQLDEAVASYRRTLELKPDYAEAHSNFGIVLQSLGQLDEAVASCRRALELKPDFAEAHSNLGNALQGLGQLAAAVVSYRLALEFRPDYAEAYSNLGAALQDLGQLDDAATSCRRALEIKPDYAEAHSNLASTLAYLSDFDQVVMESDAALRLKPGDAIGWGQRLYAFSYHPDLSAEQIYAEFVRWGDRFPDPVVDFSAHGRSPGRRLRIGYVSPDFRRHTSRFFFWPLFANHDHAIVELYAYSNVGAEDDVTQEFKGLFDHWRNIRGVADSEAARMIRADGIDILVDCCSHMRDDRLGVFTLKPAPIQATWLGAAWTTGLKMIDYALIDPYMAPAGTLTREAIVRLPHCFVAYRPPEQTAEIAPPPCLKNGHVTFGYTGRTERLNHHTFRVWGEILRQNPTARLVLDYRPFADPPTQAHYRQFMEKHGVDISRVIMRRSANIFEGLNDIDILLDCFPHSGGTMLFDALWMGVPILTLASRPPVGRIGTSLMINLGLPEWVAESQEEYIGKAATLAKNTQMLTQLRAGMRERMRNSPIMDGAGFARGVEAAYREMFEKWAKG